MRKSQIGTAIIWTIGVLYLTCFILLGLLHAEWNWGLIFFVVALFGWGLQRLFFPSMLAWVVRKYKERVDFKHGWEVDLKCPSCGHEGLPECSEGRTPKPKEWNENPADNSVICANATCAECGHDLKEQAGIALAGLFEDVPKTTIGLLGVVFVVLSFLPVLPFTLAVLIEFGAIGGWLAAHFHWWFWPSLLAPAAIVVVFEYLMHPLIYVCECSNARFLFMGLLGRSYCFRCSSCSRLLRRGR
jgi:hypothetical protein